MSDGKNGGGSLLRQAARLWPITLILALNIIVELFIRGLAVLWDVPSVRVRGGVLEYTAFWPGLLSTWTPRFPSQPSAMFVTYGFVHGGLLHLGVNMLTLLSIGPRSLMRAGVWGFFAIYAVSLVGGAAFFAVASPGPTPMVGASGALFGLAGAILSWEFTDRTASSVSLRPVAQALAYLVVLNLVLWWAMSGLLAWQTHLGGFVAGWATALWVGRAK